MAHDSIHQVIEEAAREEGIAVSLAWRQLIDTLKGSYGGALPPHVRQELISFHREFAWFLKHHLD